MANHTARLELGMKRFLGRVADCWNAESDFNNRAAVSTGASNSFIFCVLAQCKLSVANESLSRGRAFINESLGTPCLRWRAFCAYMPKLAASVTTSSSKISRRYVNVFVLNVSLVFWLLQRIKNFHDVFQFFFVVERYTDFSFSFR